MHKIVMILLLFSCFGIVSSGSSQLPELTLKAEEQGLWSGAGMQYARFDSADTLTIQVPAGSPGGDFKLARSINLAQHKGHYLYFSVEVRAVDVTVPRNIWNGIKFMVHYRSEKYGEVYRNPSDLHGTFDWKTLTFPVYVPDDVEELTLYLGLEDSVGMVAFRNLLLSATPESEEISESEYTPDVRNRAPLRGVMGAGVFRPDDLETLHQWGGNLIRWQLVRNWGKVGDNRDLAEYGAWLDDKLAEFDLLLAEAERLGISVILDLHSLPGGILPADQYSDMAMFYERKYADYFVRFWRRVALRYKDKPAFWGYDLVNEPMQSRPSSFGYRELQYEAARAIREVDPERPIIMAANDFQAPRAFLYLKPLPLVNIIYQVHFYEPLVYTHQGVANWSNVGTFSYPGIIMGRYYDRETLRRELKPVRDFQLRYNARIYVGEFSAVRWAPGAERYLADSIAIFEEYGWDWSYHAMREWSGWSVEHSEDPAREEPESGMTARKKVLLDAFRKNKEKAMQMSTDK